MNKREIKFKIWDLENKEWVRQDDFAEWSDSENTLDGIFEETKNVEFCQFTGLQDKNGREIYEGDIIYYILSTNPLIEGKAKITWYNFGWEMTELNDEGSSPLLKLENIEIIGNIFENPELCEK